MQSKVRMGQSQFKIGQVGLSRLSKFTIRRNWIEPG